MAFFGNDGKKYNKMSCFLPKVAFSCVEKGLFSYICPDNRAENACSPRREMHALI